MLVAVCVVVFVLAIATAMAPWLIARYQSRRRGRE